MSKKRRFNLHARSIQERTTTLFMDSEFITEARPVVLKSLLTLLMETLDKLSFALTEVKRILHSLDY